MQHSGLFVSILDGGLAFETQVGNILGTRMKAVISLQERLKQIVLTAAITHWTSIVPSLGLFSHIGFHRGAGRYVMCGFILKRIV